jgi:hypothetical protein
MKDRKENPIMLYRIRFECGYSINPNIEWTNPRIKEIALRQEALHKELDNLDDELLQIVKDYCKENNINFNKLNE